MIVRSAGQKISFSAKPTVLPQGKTAGALQLSNTRIFPQKPKRPVERQRYYFLQQFLEETTHLPVADRQLNRQALQALGTRWQVLWQDIFETFHRFNHLDSTFRHMLRNNVDLTWGYFKKDATPVERQEEMARRRDLLREICQARPRDMHQERARYATFMKFLDPDLQFIRELAGFFRNARVKGSTSHELGRVVSEIFAIEAAVHDIALANLRLMHRLVKKFSSDKLTYLDFVLEGYSGLLSAVGRYDVRQGAEFSTYAEWWIHQALQKAYDRLRPAGISVERIQQRHKLNREYKDLWQRTQGGGCGRPEELIRMAEIEIDLQRLRDTQSPVSLNGDLSRRALGFSLMHVVPNPGDNQDLYRAELLTLLEDKVRNLPSPNREIIIFRFGLLGNEPLSLEATAAKVQGHFGRLVSKEAISLRQDAAIRTLFGTMDLYRAFAELYGTPEMQNGRSHHTVHGSKVPVELAATESTNS